MTNYASPPIRLAWIVWGMGALFYLMGFFHRVAPVVMTAELMQTFEIGAMELGTLSALYFYAYVAMQIPTGILADIWGDSMLISFIGNKRAQLIIKIIGFALSLTGIFIVAKYQLYLLGIILVVVGIYFAAFLGTKTFK